MCILLCLASFSLHSMCQFTHGTGYGWFIFIVVWYCLAWLYHNRFTHLFLDGHLGCNQFLSLINNIVLNILVYLLMKFSTYLCSTVDYILKSRLSEPSGMHSDAVSFPKCLTKSHFHQQCMEVQLLHAFSLANIWYSRICLFVCSYFVLFPL